MSKNKLHLYHIAYSEETWSSIPDGMLPLDNRKNERPDWAEYWPIRNFLLNEVLDENTFYGFLSPRFIEKSLFGIHPVINFIKSVDETVDIVPFSPAYDARAIFLNVFEHGEFCHPGFIDLSQNVISKVIRDVDIKSIINTSHTAIFCNYIAAKPRFWRKWLSICERIFFISESKNNLYANLLNTKYIYRSSSMPAKVFLIERIASFILSTDSNFKIEKFNQSTRTTPFDLIPYEILKTLDTLKILAIDDIHNRTVLLSLFKKIRDEAMQTDSPMNKRKEILNLYKNTQCTVSSGYECWGGFVENKNKNSNSLFKRWFTQSASPSTP